MSASKPIALRGSVFALAGIALIALGASPCAPGSVEIPGLTDEVRVVTDGSGI
jgi:hypothetical protein